MSNVRRAVNRQPSLRTETRRSRTTHITTSNLYKSYIEFLKLKSKTFKIFENFTSKMTPLQKLKANRKFDLQLLLATILTLYKTSIQSSTGFSKFTLRFICKIPSN